MMFRVDPISVVAWPSVYEIYFVAQTTINLIKRIILKQMKENYLKLSHIISLYKDKCQVSPKI